MGRFNSWIRSSAPLVNRPSFVNMFQENTLFTWVGSRAMFDKVKSRGIHHGVLRSDWGDMEESDYDFIFDNRERDAHTFLTQKGFEIVGQREVDPHYEDSTFGSLYRHPDVKGIDVLGKLKFQATKRLWEQMDPAFFYRYLWKSNPTRDPEKLEEHKLFIRHYFEELTKVHQAYRTETQEAESVIDWDVANTISAVERGVLDGTF